MKKTEKIKPKICIITTVGISIRSFYPGQLKALQKAGFEVTVIAGKDESLSRILPKGVHYKAVSFSRTVNPLIDFLILLQLMVFFKKEHFSIIQYSTPKAALIGSIAAFITRSPRRIYILWGLYYTGLRGIGKRIYKTFEKLICQLSHIIIPISHEMVDFALKEGLGSPGKYEVMLSGSACGVDLTVFDPGRWSSSRKKIRSELKIPDNGIVIGMVARLTGDKGINEVTLAFDRLSNKQENTYLLLVGSREEKDRPRHETEYILSVNPNIRQVGWQDNPLPYYAAMDIFCLPTYREGFGEVNLEAQAMSLPVVSTNTIGPRESIDNGVTGLLVTPRSIDAVYEAMKSLSENGPLCKQMGELGRRRVREKFDRQKLIDRIVEHRLGLIRSL